MLNELEKIYFTTRVLGPVAAYRLERHQVTQTLRSNSNSITNAIINGRVSAGDRLKVVLDNVLLGKAEFVSMFAITWGALGIDDANRGGFDSLEDLEKTLKRAGYRFKPLNNYQLFRIRFSWLEKVYA